MQFRKRTRKNGFTLVELIVVIAILGILAAIAVPGFASIIDESVMAVDKANLRMLNGSTTLYGISKTVVNDDIFDGITTDSNRIEKLVTEGYLDDILVTQNKDQEFKWNIDNQKWLLGSKNYVLTSADVTMGEGGFFGYIIDIYDGSHKDIVIPKSLNNTIVTDIYQDVFGSKGLTSITFEEDSKITHIHARAFQNNSLTEIELPDKLENVDTSAFYNNNIKEITLPPSMKKIESHAFKNNELTEIILPTNMVTIGGYAFENNNITKITIGSSVTLGEKVFQNNNNFRDIYTSQGGGAGTYSFINGNWVKQ